jgi:formate dehydrogenase major subunit
MHYDESSQIMDEIAQLTPTFAGVSFAKLDEVGSVQWPCNEAKPMGTPIMHEDRFVRGLGRFSVTPYVPTEEKSTRRFPLLLTTGRILSQYNVGAQTRRTANVQWHGEDVLEIHPADAEERGIRTGDEVTLASRVGTTTLHAVVSDRMAQGVVYTTFHHPVSGANVVTTENSDWATNCPEYKVTAVQVSPGHSAATVEIDHPEHRLGALVRMANQIARQMAADPHADAVASTAYHLDRFWELEMRADLVGAIDGGTVTVDDVVLRAVDALRVAG